MGDMTQRAASAEWPARAFSFSRWMEQWIMWTITALVLGLIAGWFARAYLKPAAPAKKPRKPRKPKGSLPA
jgi:hypothetical protein